jgi:hypothetical protein
MKTIGSTKQGSLQALDPKSFRREEEQIIRHVYTGAGRQQQAGKRDYLLAWGGGFIEVEDPMPHDVVAFAGPSGSLQKATITYTGSGQIEIDSSGSVDLRVLSRHIASLSVFVERIS